ncbi:MAG: hypothetical protein Q9225_004954 [Loekoesia sp. 1 TL-2023]
MVVRAGLSSEPGTEPQSSSAEVLGNLFIFMFAGHEANANTLTFIIVLLSCHPLIQKHLQHDIDSIVGPPESGQQKWSYQDHYSLLADSMVGTVINEALRLFTVLPFIPKQIPEGTSLSFRVRDSTLSLAPGTLVLINTSALHRHPDFWPQSESEALREKKHNPVADFNPNIWLCSKPGHSESPQGPNHLRKPDEGTFVLFSGGALVELCCLVARIFSEYSVQLALDDNPAPDSASDLSGEQWESARKRAEDQLYKGVEFNMSLRLVGSVPLALVKRSDWK